jgi:beta-carotene 15,15'-dioxygenase
MTGLPQRAAFLAVAVCAGMVLALALLRTLEAQWPPLALWAFVLLSLTLGFGHGALDAVLLLAQFAPRSRALAVSAAYLLCVLLAGWLLSWSVPLALLLLVLMSVWHFGELHSHALWARLCVGGASVMWPVLVAPQALALLLQDALGSGFALAWGGWQVLAYGWLAFVLACALGGMAWCVAHREKFASASQVLASPRLRTALWAALEITAVLCAYFVLSPLLAFALYFGLYHCVAHVARVRRALLAHSSAVVLRYTLAFVASALATAALLAVLWWFLPGTPWLGGVGPALANLQANSGQVLQWLVVSLAAVTLPHLVLVSYSARWLGR